MTEAMNKYDDIAVTIGQRENGSQWISVEHDDGRHFQCDYTGDAGKPEYILDFYATPPTWVSLGLELS